MGTILVIGVALAIVVTVAEAGEIASNWHSMLKAVGSSGSSGTSSQTFPARSACCLRPRDDSIWTFGALERNEAQGGSMSVLMQLALSLAVFFVASVAHAEPAIICGQRVEPPIYSKSEAASPEASALYGVWDGKTGADLGGSVLNDTCVGWFLGPVNRSGGFSAWIAFSSLEPGAIRNPLKTGVIPWYGGKYQNGMVLMPTAFGYLGSFELRKVSENELDGYHIVSGRKYRANFLRRAKTD